MSAPFKTDDLQEKRKGFRLNTGRIIYLDEITQWRTYSCLIEGIPRKEMNDEFIIEAEAHARKKIGLSVPIHVIPPVREKLLFSKNRPARPGREYERLPPITCAAAFESFQPARNPEDWSSCLIIVWFQERWALPISPCVVSQIRSLNWNQLARDCMP